MKKRITVISGMAHLKQVSQTQIDGGPHLKKCYAGNSLKKKKDLPNHSRLNRLVNIFYVICDHFSLKLCLKMVNNVKVYLFFRLAQTSQTHLANCMFKTPDLKVFRHSLTNST